MAAGGVLCSTLNYLVQLVHKMMSVGLKIGPERIQALPGFCNGGKWDGHLLNEDMRDVNSECEEVKSLQQQYTSLRDLILVPPTKRGMGKQGQGNEWGNRIEPKFKNNLLQLAARAYLQPVRRESRPEVHFIVQCWMAFVARNKTLIASIVDSLQKQVDVCVKFVRAQTFNLVQILKPQNRAASLAMRSV